MIFDIYNLHLIQGRLNIYRGLEFGWGPNNGQGGRKFISTAGMASSTSPVCPRLPPSHGFFLHWAR